LLTLVPTPIGNLQDITYRAIEKFNSCDVILCEDTRVTKQLITLLSKTHHIDCTAQFLSFHQHNQHKRLQSFDEHFFDKDIVFVSDAGMPAISDPGASLVRYCIEKNIEYDVLPGANAAITAFAASGYEGAFTFYGFLPKEKRAKALQKVMQAEEFAILHEAPHRIERLIQEICAIDSQRELFLAKEISKKFQTFYKAKAKDISLESTKGEWVVIISPRVSQKIVMSLDEIKSLDMTPKSKAKLLAKYSNKSAKEWYNELINS